MACNYKPSPLLCKLKVNILIPSDAMFLSEINIKLESHVARFSRVRAGRQFGSLYESLSYVGRSVR